MEVNETMSKQITETAYLTTENTKNEENIFTNQKLSGISINKK